MQFSAVARRRRMFPRQPPASAPASCTREPMTVFKALADRHRVKILNRLLAANGEAVCVCDFEAMLDLKQPTVSYHLKQLLNAGIVTREKRGSFAYFALDPTAFERIRDLLAVPVRAVAA
jgi:ArsR family transcriptional regulator